MANAKQDAVLGVVFFAAIGLLLAATLLLSNFSFQAKPQIEVRFPSAGGLERGDAVYVLGRRAGEVAEVGYRADLPTHRIVTRLQFDEPMPLAADAKFEIVDASLLGGKRIDIEPGTGSPTPANQPRLGIVRMGPVDALSAELQGDDGLIGGLKTAVKKLNEGEGTLAKLFNDSSLHDSLLAAAQSLTTSLKAIQDSRGALGKIIHDEKLGDDLGALVSSLRAAADKVNAGQGPLGVALNDRDVADKLRNIISDVAAMTREMREGRGTLGYLLRDNDGKERVARILADLGDVLAKSGNKEAGLVGALVNDPQLLADARGILQSFREFADRAAHGNGLLARLNNDPDWGRRFGQILGQVSRAIEDAREAAPVGTFFQVLTGFF
jgi:ABC-type transporter Mla subunit MlaD